MRGGEVNTNKETNTKTNKNTNKTANIKTNILKQQERMWNPIVISREGREEREKSRRSGMLQRVSSISRRTLNCFIQVVCRTCQCINTCNRLPFSVLCQPIQVLFKV